EQEGQQTETEATGAPQKHHYTLNQQVGSITGFSGGDADLVKYIEVGTWYYFNKNMNVYAAYKFNQLDDNDYTKAAGVATDDQAAVGIVYQF
ncbi:porin, partial [Klebsiella pneumoniae]